MRSKTSKQLKEYDAFLAEVDYANDALDECKMDIDDGMESELADHGVSNENVNHSNQSQTVMSKPEETNGFMKAISAMNCHQDTKLNGNRISGMKRKKRGFIAICPAKKRQKEQ